MRVCATLVVASTMLGCGARSAFVCESTEDCATSGTDGICEPSGYCSFPADGCGSGRRYGTHASPELAGECVPADIAEDTSTSDPGEASELEGPSEADDTSTSTTFDPTMPLEGSSSAATSTSTTLDDTASTTSEATTGTIDPPVFEIEYVATIAACTQDTVYDAAACAAQAGADQITIDQSDGNGLPSTGWLRFEIDDALLDAEVLGAEIVVVVGPRANDASTSTGELWTTEPFDPESLSSGNPALIELVGENLGAVRLGSEIVWPLPPELIVTDDSLFFAISPTATDGLDLWDNNSATPPRLVVTAQ